MPVIFVEERRVFAPAVIDRLLQKGTFGKSQTCRASTWQSHHSGSHHRIFLTRFLSQELGRLDYTDQSETEIRLGVI